MGNTIFSAVIVFAFFLAVEYIMMGAFQAAGFTKTKRILGGVCRAFLAVCIVAYLVLIGLFLFVEADLLMEGEIEKGISLLLSAVVVAACVYVWLVRRWIQRI